MEPPRITSAGACKRRRCLPPGRATGALRAERPRLTCGSGPPRAGSRLLDRQGRRVSPRACHGRLPVRACALLAPEQARARSMRRARGEAAALAPPSGAARLPARKCEQQQFTAAGGPVDPNHLPASAAQGCFAFPPSRAQAGGFSPSSTPSRCWFLTRWGMLHGRSQEW